MATSRPELGVRGQNYIYKTQYTITEHRIRLEDDFSDSPSLKRYFSEIFDESYQKARKLAADETGLPLEIFPSESPFTPEQTLNSDYLPE
jgi:hypothetical protein